MNKVTASVRGVNRIIHLSRQLSANKWKAKVYVNTPSVRSGRTSVAGVYQVYQNGTKRFTATGDNANLL